jgi:hypothetical protein
MDAPIRPFPSRRMLEPRYLAETFDLSMATHRLDRTIQRMVNEPLRLEYERAVAALRPDDLPVGIVVTVGDWLFSCPPEARLVGRFGLYVKDAIEELSQLKGPIAMVLEGWEEPFLECVADAHTPSLKHSVQMPSRALSINRPDSTW